MFLVSCRLSVVSCASQPRTTDHGPRTRSAISLTEVLIAMGIMTVGLLGVASVFPVGSWYLQKASIKDQGSAIAQSVMSDLMASGKLNPGAWYVMTPVPINTNPIHPNYRFTTIDGKYTPVGTPVPGTFTRPFGESLREGLKRNPNGPGVLAKQFGHAFVIDPLFVASASTNAPLPGGGMPNGSANITAYAFPATAYAVFPYTGSYYYGNKAWDSWRATNNTTTGEKAWPIRRVSFQQSNGWTLDKVGAESMARSTDDLAYDFPQRADRPSIQTWDTVTASTSAGTNTLPLARKWTGDFSWIVSVVPTTNAARDGMARNPEGFSYDVSVVVFYKRSLPSSPPQTSVNSDLGDAAMHERVVSAKILSTGLSGGELLLERPMISSTTAADRLSLSSSPYDGLKTGEWIMLCGPHPNSSAIEPRFALQWYQVISIDKEGAGINGFDPTNQRVVSVRGPEWPWKPRASYSNTNSDVAKLSDDLCVGICRGAVAVHTKTLRLESPLGGSFGTGTSMITPPGVNQDFVTY
jgi:hypothetical protein